MKDSYLFLAPGFEEIEALTAVDVLRRAEIPVKTVSVSGDKSVEGAHGIKVEADLLLAEASFEDAPWLVLPGGMPGATNLYECKELADHLLHLPDATRVAAICAAPAVVLGQLGLLKDERATCYPGFEAMLGAKEVVDAPVVVSGRYVLGNGPANAMVWALTIVREARGIHDCLVVSNGMLYFPRVDAEVDHYFG